MHGHKKYYIQNISSFFLCVLGFFFLCFRIPFVQPNPGGTTAAPHQAVPSPGQAFYTQPLATLGFTAIAPAAGQTLVQPVVGQPPLLAPAPPLSCQSQSPMGQSAASTGRQVREPT